MNIIIPSIKILRRIPLDVVERYDEDAPITMVEKDCWLVGIKKRLEGHNVLMVTERDTTIEEITNLSSHDHSEYLPIIRNSVLYTPMLYYRAHSNTDEGFSVPMDTAFVSDWEEETMEVVLQLAYMFNCNVIVFRLGIVDKKFLELLKRYRRTCQAVVLQPTDKDAFTALLSS